MKVKDLERTANIAWSPANQYPILLAAGTAAQQLDASFSTNAVLEIYALNLNEPGLDMELKANVSSEHRFHKIVWGPHGIGSDCGNGLIVGGCDGGILQIYNAQKLLNNENGLVSRQDKHSGPVHALDFNPFQTNLLATGAGESEIFIWDMNNTKTPMTPGAKSQPFEDVLSIAWNRQVQHILASTFTTKCVVWDLRKNEPIIKLTDTVSRIRWKVVAWHPEVATQLCLASEDDQMPIIQLWDLRFATSPLKVMENHQRGVLSLAWCPHDPDLLISCGKDNRIVCWNPNSNLQNGEVLSEIVRTNQWNFDVAWCPRNPAVVASPCFDGHVSVYSLMGGKTQQIQTTNKIADSFPGMDGYVDMAAPLAQQNAAPISADLTKPPKWLKRPVGAVFCFGGKLITFQNDVNASAQVQQNQQQPGQFIQKRFVVINQVITEPELVRKSNELEQALESGDFKEYCINKADSTSDQHKKYIWHFLKAQFEEDSREELLNLLGYKMEDINTQLNQYVESSLVDGVTNQFANLNKKTNACDGNTNSMSNGSFDYSLGDYGGLKLNECNSTLQAEEEPKRHIKPFTIKTGNDNEGLIAQALILGNVEAAVQLCFKAKRYADAIIIAMTGGSELLAKTQLRYFQQSEGYLSSLISALVSEDWAAVINNCEVNSWKEALAAVLTHASDEELPFLCEQMGDRLEKESNGELSQEAQLCYICAGSFEKLVGAWSGDAKQSTHKLQELVELVTFLLKAVERQGRRHVELAGNLAELLSHYASILASQGNLQTALNYLGSSQDELVASLRERLLISLGLKSARSELQQPQSRRSSNMRNSFTSYGNNQQPIQQQQQQVSSNNYGMGVVNQPWHQQANPMYVAAPPKTFSPASVPPVQPPRPTSVGSAHGGSGLTVRNKYVVDPSVQSNNQYGATRNQFVPNPLLPPQPQPNFQMNAVSNMAAPTNPYTPFVPSTATSFSQPPPTANSANIMNPMATSIGSNIGYNQQSDSFNELPAEMGQSAMNYLPMNTAPGWNDPPVLHKSQNKQEFTPQEPIMHPLYGTAPVQNNGHMNQPLQNNQAYRPPPPSGAAYGQGGFNTQAVVPNYNFTQPMQQQQQQQPQQQNHERIIEKIEPVQKLPIPEEHVHMQTVFDELRSRCSCTASNPQTKRKLEDVSKKLEALYDLLREHKLSQSTISSLHQMVQHVQNGDYTGGLALHTQLVSGPDFAQIASFMPGLKVLLQCALQLQVYLR